MHEHSIGKFLSPILTFGPVYLSASQQWGPFTKREQASIYKNHENLQHTNSFHCQPFAMAPAISTCSSTDGHHEGSDEASPESSPRVCRCENQLVHWDWAGRLHPDLPECCRPATGKGPRNATLSPLQMVSHIPVNDVTKSVQLLKH